MKALSKIIAVLDTFTELSGKIAASAAVAMVLVTCYIVISRYVFNSGSVAIQESLIYLNTILVFLTAAFTLKHNGHVRVDIFYSQSSVRTKACINLLGTFLLLFPVCIFILWASWPYVMSSWAVFERSGQPGGLPYVYLLKTMILLMCFLLMLQGLAEILKNLRVLFVAEDTAFLSVEHESDAL